MLILLSICLASFLNSIGYSTIQKFSHKKEEINQPALKLFLSIMNLRELGQSVETDEALVPKIQKSLIEFHHAFVNLSTDLINKLELERKQNTRLYILLNIFRKLKEQIQFTIGNCEINNCYEDSIVSGMENYHFKIYPLFIRSNFNKFSSIIFI